MLSMVEWLIHGLERVVRYVEANLLDPVGMRSADAQRQGEDGHGFHGGWGGRHAMIGGVRERVRRGQLRALQDRFSITSERQAPQFKLGVQWYGEEKSQL